MKKIAAILLGGILLFNWVGYRLLNSLMEERAGLQLESQLDRRQYDESQLISLKIPVTHLSYYNNSASFERVDGQIEINGIPYQYVQRRIFNDSLELKCIPNEMTLKLRQSGNDYFKGVNDIQRSPKGQQPGSHPGTAKIFLADPYTLTDAFRLGDRAFTLVLSSCYFTIRIPSTPHTADERPPAFPV